MTLRKRKPDLAVAYRVVAPKPLVRAAPQPGQKIAGAQPSKKRAVLVVHGMGQQVPFATLVNVVEGLQDIDAKENPGTGGQPVEHTASVVEVNGTRLSRMEVSLHGSDPTRRQEVHVYEAYWAPITEGGVTLRDVMTFLCGAGFNGVRKGLQPFKRWVFGDLRKYHVPPSTPLHLIIALLVIAALVAINATITAVAAARALLGGTSAWLTPNFFAELSGLLTIQLGAMLLFGAAIVLSMRVGHGVLARPLNALSRISFWFLVALTVVVALSLGFLFWVNRPGVDTGAKPYAWLEVLRSLPVSQCVAWRFFLWPGLVGLSEYVRRLLVQYVGDVAAYVSSHKLDHFDKMRNEIKDRVHDVARAIYALRSDNGSGSEYEQVAIVGHSLGSVAVYDCLNRLLNDDDIYEAMPAALRPDETAAPPVPGAHEHLNVRERTCVLLTFGSPLDKTAYVFGTRGAWRVHEDREALAATVQPLIRDPQARSLPWINVYSDNDIISGRLKFYDLPDGEPDPPGALRVKNLPDPDTTTWLAAHTEYWKTSVVWDELHQALIR